MLFDQPHHQERRFGNDENGALGFGVFDLLLNSRDPSGFNDDIIPRLPQHFSVVSPYRNPQMFCNLTSGGIRIDIGNPNDLGAVQEFKLLQNAGAACSVADQQHFYAFLSVSIIGFAHGFMSLLLHKKAWSA